MIRCGGGNLYCSRDDRVDVVVFRKNGFLKIINICAYLCLFVHLRDMVSCYKIILWKVG